MNHLLEEEIIAVSTKVSEGLQLDSAEKEMAEHILKCEQCRKKFSLCMEMLDFMKADKLEAFFEGRARERLAEKMLYQLHFAVNAATGRLQHKVEWSGYAMPRFTRANAFAAARGAGDGDCVELEAEESSIVYDREEKTLTVSLDEEVFGEDRLVAVLKTGEQEREMPFVPDRYGMLEAEFEQVDSEDVILYIRKK